MPDVSELRRLSKDLLGNKYRAEIAHAIAGMDEGPLTPRRVSGETGIGYARVHEDFQRLVAAGLLEANGDPVTSYARSPSVYWQACVGLYGELLRR